MGYGKAKLGTCFTILAVLLAIYYRSSSDVLQKKLYNVLKALERLESKYMVNPRPKVAIGYGICTDVYIEAGNLLKYSENIGQPQHFDEISTKEELLKSFAYYFRHGAAAERFMSNNTLFDDLVASARSYSSSYSTIGGNAAVMAMRLVREGCDVVLAARLTTSLLQMIPQAITVVGGEVERDDIHLILEYKRGETWGPYTSARANRYIVHNDRHNPKMSGLEELGQLLPEFKPDLLIISGLQMMDNYPFGEGDRMKSLEKIKDQMRSQRLATKIHFEMASFAEENLMMDLNKMVIPYADSLGMNEQEITNLHNSLYYGNISLVANSTPRVATVLDQMRELFRLIRSKSEGVEGSRILTRIHVHTLAYQAILTVKNSSWKNTIAAAAKASLTAHRHVCSTNNIDLQKATLIMDDSFTTSIISGTRIPLNVDKPVACWNEVLHVASKRIDIDLCVAPVLVCTEVSQTAGGGDNVSSAGLVLQI
ncbi:PREDICTED: ADP-dependent glucokinase [Ceratosolen solmsi marchali]|uniref:ADP-dependent glucokinase n=1 Tax=Ceratosolen solmsi marchali TaxID=326594 RepID=A0AAJ7E203_9HYME|nr:PREDICTED: ADP-dependent glucokinase [Ceratosolen solmsi marchali]